MTEAIKLMMVLKISECFVNIIYNIQRVEISVFKLGITDDIYIFKCLPL